MPLFLRRSRSDADITSMLLARSLLLLGTLAIVATLWVTLLSGGGGHAPAAGGYSSAIDAAHSAVQQSK